MHGFVTIREPRSGDQRVRLKLFRFIQYYCEFFCQCYPFPTVSTQFVIYTLYIKLKYMYPRFFRFLDSLHFISYTFYEIIILSCDLTSSERKKTLKKRCIYNLIDSCHFTYTYSLISQMLAF